MKKGGDDGDNIIPFDQKRMGGRSNSPGSRDKSLSKPFTPDELKERSDPRKARPRMPREFDVPLKPVEERYADAMMLCRTEEEAAEKAGVRASGIKDFVRRCRSKPNIQEAIRQRMVVFHSRKPGREFLQKMLLEMAVNPLIGADTKHKVIRTLSEMQGYLQNQNAGGNFNLNFTVVSPDGTPLAGFTPPQIEAHKTMKDVSDDE